MNAYRLSFLPVYIYIGHTMIRLAIKAAALLCFTLSLQGLTGQVKVTPIEIGKKVTALGLSDSGALLYGTADGELGRYDGILTKAYAHVKKNTIINKTAEKGFIYTSKGLALLDGRVRTVSNANLNVLTAAPDGSLLVTTSGIFKKQGLDYVLNDSKNLPNRSDIKQADYLLHNGSPYLLIDQQLYRKEQRWQLMQDSVIDLAASTSNLYLLTYGGIYTVDGEVKYYHSGQRGDKILAGRNGELLLLSGNIVTLIANGQAREVYSIATSMVTDMVQDQWGNYWIAAGSYLYRISQLQATSALDPSLDILSINGSEVLADPLDLKQGQARLDVRYKGVQLTRPQQLQYQSILEGYADWSEPTKEEQVVYEHIPAGKYLLQLRATVDGINFTYSPRYKVTVTDATAYTIWIGLLMAGVGILLTALITNQRYTTHKKKSEAEREKLLNQNRILTLQQKALQLQMNPHFIFNALNSIKGLIAKGESKQARKSLTDFAQLMRSTLEHSRADSIAIADEVQYLDRYLHIEQWTNERRFDYEVLVDPGVDTEQHIPTMLLQPFVENAVKHAFKGKTDKGHIWVRMQQKGLLLYCEIEDDGIGIQDTSTTSHESVAIAVVRERLAQQKMLDSKYLQIDSPLADGGTKVTLCIKVKGY